MLRPKISELTNLKSSWPIVDLKLVILLAGTACIHPALANNTSKPISFQEVGVALGVNYARTSSATQSSAEAFRNDSFVNPKTLMDVPSHPLKPRGAPGVAILDYDGDNDLDIYVTNGPGAANSLFSNQLVETGDLGFVDVGLSAGIDAADQDSTGVCYADIDNDGDEDVYVLGRNEPNRLFENDGAGFFVDITPSVGVGGGAAGSTSCSFGDVDNDGLLDLFVANVTDFSSMAAILAEPFSLNQADFLFRNLDANRFADISSASGIQTLVGVPAGSNGLTWAATMVDYDQDGDTDILTASDNGGVPFAAEGGVDRGFLRIFDNDGTGFFEDVTDAANLLGSPGDWMGISIADFNHDGTLDAFLSNTGDYFEAFLGIPGSQLGGQTSRHFLQNPDGTWTDSGVDPDLASVFGWGTAAFDYDNDGDTDVAYVGGLDIGLIVESSNPGVILQNDGGSNFVFDNTALQTPLAADHVRRNEHGMAVGDLNQDGFVDFVSVSNQNVVPPLPLVPYAAAMSIPFNSPFNALASFAPVFNETAPGQFVWTGLNPDNGTLAIEMNSANNGNRSVEVALLGSIGLTPKARVNRNGIGAVVSFKPRRKLAATKPVLGGSSYASQNSLAITFGMGKSRRGRLDVLWPGGVRNRLYNVRHSERVLFPEIPCSYKRTVWNSFRRYVSCVRSSLNDLRMQGVIGKKQRNRFFASAVRAFFDKQ